MAKYKGLSAKDKDYLAWFEKAYSGRLKKKDYDEQNVPEDIRRQLYRNRYRHRQDRGFSPRVIRFQLNERNLGSTDPLDTLVRAYDELRILESRLKEIQFRRLKGKKKREWRIISPLWGKRRNCALLAKRRPRAANPRKDAN